jgi:hypothetical protein
MHRSFALVTTAALTLCAHSVYAQQTLYAIGNGGTTLIRFSSDNPAAVTVVGNFSGANIFLDAISFRPSTGQLYGYLDSTDSFYTVNTSTGALTLVTAGAAAAPTNTFHLGLAFNPVVDRARIVTDSGQNIVYNPATNSTTAATGLQFAAGDPNANLNPSIIENAYTNSRAGATTTAQYAIDYANDLLVTLANDSGVLGTVGPLGVNTDVYTGFEIYTSAGGVNTAYALLTPAGGVPSLYTVSLTTGQATLVGALGFTNQVYSLAVIPAPSAMVPLAMLVGGLSRRRVRAM